MGTVKRKLLLITAVMLSILLMISHAPDEIYRSEYSLCIADASNDCSKHNMQWHNKGKDDEYMLGFVEINDQGQMRDRAQMAAILDHYYTVAAQDSLLITVYVHGWQHNASPDDSNVASFSGYLQKLSLVEADLAKRQNRPPRKIAGVYVGWRGQSVEIPGLNLITFWERKSAALDVGYLGITELFLKLEEISNVRNSWSPPIKSRLIIMGHSFGGQAVYGATAQILASRFIDSREHKTVQDDAKGFGDLVVLLNPAFEALRYLPLHDLSNSRCSYFESQRPRLAILTSETDYATKLAFPAGRFMSTMFEAYGTIERTFCSGKHKRELVLNEGDADRTTVGHFDPLISHELTPVLVAESLSIEAYDNIDNIWGLQAPGATTAYGRTALKHLNRTEPRNPYLNIRVSPELIADHGDIWRDEVQEFIRLLVVLAAHDEALDEGGAVAGKGD
ncbi:esterase [Nitrosomonas sp. sh817]|uniref:esterase n=1 Tax=Nitrosomonas sp. sh817 TaxID=3070658 RepID=UPI0027DB14CA|nr:esterase [Nitrosomonas sp. sh817]WMJ09975.1 esterase [Nitrosomonas sp. sh817]